MQETIAVALITASSTISGVALTVFVSLRITSRQLKMQAIMAENGYHEQRTSWLREVRRETYIKFISELDGVNRKLQDTWLLPAPEVSDELATIRPLLLRLREVANLVRLEGPPEIGSAALEASTNTLQHFMALQRLATEAKVADRTESLAEFSQDDWDTQGSDLISHHAHFINCAQQALGGNLPVWMN
ncbi:hypothetical protein [Streptomyces sp. URMC 129]|uniref:hypothetical protein n=1 Tax=Streptomyces sp. URMC 129 TaxID=3423407 RepID=UPI003F193C9C